MKDSFEGMTGGAMEPEADRPEFDSLEAATETKLREKGLSNLFAVVSELSPAEKDALGHAINDGNYSWEFLTTFTESNDAQAAQRIAAWKEEIKEAQNTDAKRKAGKQLIDDLYEL